MKTKLNNILLILFFGCAISLNSYSQDTVSYTLDEVLEIAQTKSLASFIAENEFMAGYWEYRSYRAGLRPGMSLRLTPVSYNRTLTERYDINTNTDVYMEQQTLNNYANLSLNQKIMPTGGQVFLDTEFNRLENFGTNALTSYNVTPIRIGLIQPIFAYNSYKWDHIISPLKFDKAKQDYLLQLQEINQYVVGLYFNVALAQKQKEIATQNLSTATTMLEIGQKRIAIAMIEQEDLLNLELTKYNAEIQLTKSEKNLDKAWFNFTSYLGLDKSTRYQLIVPEINHTLQVDASEAIGWAWTYNPAALELKQRNLEAERNLDRTIKENRMDMDLRASYGLNQQAEEFNNAFNDLLDQELISLNMNIPILDWGERKGKREMALRHKKVVEIQTQQQQIDFEQTVALKVIDFNLQSKIVEGASKADAIAEESYELTQKRFKMGQVDVMKLNNAREESTSAKERYINSLYDYWRFYYELQGYTLYDLHKQAPITMDFEELY